MNYYKRHIGDYAAKAGHLSPLEHGVYSLLIDAYYNREEAPTKAEAIRWARARSADELAALDAVLAEFFIEAEGRFTQNRVEDELAQFRARQEANRYLGAKGGKANAKRIATQSLSETLSETLPEIEANEKPSHKPLANSHKPEEKKNPEIAASAATPRTKAVTLTAWLDSMPDGDAIPADDPVFAYADKVGLPQTFLELSWAWFHATYTNPSTAQGAKRYADWRAVYRNAVRGGWGNLWKLGANGEYFLTTQGLQAQREFGL